MTLIFFSEPVTLWEHHHGLTTPSPVSAQWTGPVPSHTFPLSCSRLVSLCFFSGTYCSNLPVWMCCETRCLQVDHCRWVSEWHFLELFLAALSLLFAGKGGCVFFFHGRCVGCSSACYHYLPRNKMENWLVSTHWGGAACYRSERADSGLEEAQITPGQGPVPPSPQSLVHKKRMWSGNGRSRASWVEPMQ